MNLVRRTDTTMKICFIAPSAYPLLSGRNPKNILGPDVHQVLLANELIKYDFKISFLAHNKGREPVECIRGMDVIKIPEDDYRLKILNVVLKLFRIWYAQRKAKAHIYLYRGGTVGSFSPFCRLMKKKFILQISSDALVNVEPTDRKIKGFNRFFSICTSACYWLDIKLADVIIVQNEYQRTMLKNNFDKKSILIKKPFPLSERGMQEKANPSIVLWVGAMNEVKQPELFVKLAEAIPEVTFQMIGGYSSENQVLYDKIKESSKRIPNVEYLGVIPLDEINHYFSQASILVNTSMFEAYPTLAIIQAWMNYTPVISLADNSDEIICKYRMGFHSKTFNQLVEDVKTLLKDERLRKEMGMNGRKYAEREHDLTSIVREYIKLFNRIGEF